MSNAERQHRLGEKVQDPERRQQYLESEQDRYIKDTKVGILLHLHQEKKDYNDLFGKDEKRKDRQQKKQKENA